MLVGRAFSTGFSVVLLILTVVVANYLVHTNSSPDIHHLVQRQLEMLGSERAGLEDMLKEMKKKDDILPKLMATSGSYEDLFKKELGKYYPICQEVARNVEAQEQLLHQIQDDILPKLMATSGSYEDLFKKELGKYYPICQEVARNVEAQEQLLRQIQAQNDAFAKVFNLEDYKAAHAKGYKQISAAIAKYQEIRDNINEGLKFYVTLQDAITNLKQQCMTHNIQRHDMMKVQQELAGLRGLPHRQLTQRAVPDPQHGQQTGGPPAPYHCTSEQSVPPYSSKMEALGPAPKC